MNSFTASDNLYAVRSSTGVDTYNYLRFKFEKSNVVSFALYLSHLGKSAAEKPQASSTRLTPHYDGGEIDISENGFDFEINGEEV